MLEKQLISPKTDPKLFRWMNCTTDKKGNTFCNCTFAVIKMTAVKGTWKEAPCRLKSPACCSASCRLLCVSLSCCSTCRFCCTGSLYRTHTLRSTHTPTQTMNRRNTLTYALISSCTENTSTSHTKNTHHIHHLMCMCVCVWKGANCKHWPCVCVQDDQNSPQTGTFSSPGRNLNTPKATTPTWAHTPICQLHIQKLKKTLDSRSVTWL